MQFTTSLLTACALTLATSAVASAATQQHPGSFVVAQATDSNKAPAKSSTNDNSSPGANGVINNGSTKSGVNTGSGVGAGNNNGTGATDTSRPGTGSSSAK